LPLDESGYWTVTLLLSGKESLQLLGDDLIEQRRFRLTRSILKSSSTRHAPAREAGGRPIESMLLKGFSGQAH
jgi:hypothetical protein